MKNSFVKFCIAGCLFLSISCNNSAKDNKAGKDTTTTISDTATTTPKVEAEQPPASIVNKTAYSYDPASVITGKITTEVFYGSPGFGENPKTDEKEERYLLVLDKSINVIGPANPDDDSKESKYNVVKIQLLYDENTIDMGKYLGSTVQLTGTFFGAHTGHHHTEVLMDVTKVVVQ